MALVVTTFYKFVRLGDIGELKEKLQLFCSKNNIRGTILLAGEGINVTIAGSQGSIDRFLTFLQDDPRFEALAVRTSSTESDPFARLKVKIKPEIVTLGLPEVDPSERVGRYVAPRDWNQLIADPEVVTVDTRNHYEVAIGSFRGAIDPQIKSFRQFPDYASHSLDPQRHKKVALFCTGGIRCEKATALLLQREFEEVYHLQGGILNYLAQVPPQESLWEGDCFVFDGRVALQSDSIEGDYALCGGCGYPLSLEERRSPFYRAGICCSHCYELAEKGFEGIDKTNP